MWSVKLIPEQSWFNKAEALTAFIVCWWGAAGMSERPPRRVRQRSWFVHDDSLTNHDKSGDGCCSVEPGSNLPQSRRELLQQPEEGTVRISEINEIFEIMKIKLIYQSHYSNIQWKE